MHKQSYSYTVKGEGLKLGEKHENTFWSFSCMPTATGMGIIITSCIGLILHFGSVLMGLWSTVEPTHNVSVRRKPATERKWSSMKTGYRMQYSAWNSNRWRPECQETELAGVKAHFPCRGGEL